ncbi:Initiation factor 2B-related domain-containing protein [Paramicrosporidium saccamoebae]|uniref:Translation initiation factor eIF2B subunit delta n=1 Tax=Paramicrosporidium saccamoebae TaxID=1246581 RepID=A0A2H9TLM7_9FUNG|nr:Initiation factor 2B-related domain-containing protein [Paramicrosporidium saccamoebae]
MDLLSAAPTTLKPNSPNALATLVSMTDKLTVPTPKSRRSISGPLSTSFELREMPLPSATAAPVPIKAILHDDPKKRKSSKKEGIKSVALFSHLSQYAEGVRTASNIHPAVVKFALRSAQYSNLGGSRRCREMLLALKEAIKDYRMNPEMAVCRHLDLYLKPMIGYMVDARPMAVTMANAVRTLRHNISILPVETAEHEAQQTVQEFIDNIITNRLDLAGQLIVHHGLCKIADGDVILTYARSVVVRNLLVAAHEAGRKFKVIVVDARPFKEGRILLGELVASGLHCTYVHVNAIGYMMREVTKTIVGAAALYANGTVLSRVGTAAVCTLSRQHNVPVIVCCETLKFSERSQIDSFVYNEIGDPDALVRTHHPASKVTLSAWRDVEPLKLLNILYDVTPAEYVTVVITEIGLIPVTSIPVVLREYSTNSHSVVN